jgi:hypothetical protein
MFESAYLILYHIQHKKNVKKYIESLNKNRVVNKSNKLTNINVEKDHRKNSICSNASTIIS